MRSVDKPIRKLAAGAGLGLLALACCGCALTGEPSQGLASAAGIDEQTAEKAPASASYEAASQDPKATLASTETGDTAREEAARPSASPASAAGQKSETGRAAVDPQALAAVMGQLSELKSQDPAAHDQLMTDLKQVDPKLWPMLVQGFKASLEYRQRKATEVRSTELGVRSGETPTQRAATAPAAAPVQPGATVAPPATAIPTATEARPAVQPASHGQDKAPPADWRQPLEATIRSLEAAVAESPGLADDDRQVSLRMLYLLAGQRDKALRPLAGHDALAQEFWSRELYALSTYLDSQRVSDRSRRAAEAALHHWEASHRLSQQGNLLVRNLAFCTEVMSYGVYTPFDRLEFQPAQRVVLYAEVENFISQATPRGHHTALKSSYQIWDSRGQKVEDHEFPLMEEYCQNPRRDYFIAYEAIRLPAQIYDGKYTLKLTIEDTLGHKVGQSSLDFHIKQGTAGR